MADVVEPGGRSRVISWVGILVFGLPLLYFLSTGPVVLLLEKTNGFGSHVPSDFVLAFYAPIVWLYENTFLRTPIELYLNLWGIK
jgi:hypothetical protein